MKSIKYFIFYVISFNLVAQKALVPAGGDVINNTGSISFSIGQMTIKSANFINEGVLQVYDLKSTPLSEGMAYIQLKVFPNPTSGKLLLQVEEKKLRGYDYLLLDVSGKKIFSNNISAPLMQIDLKGLPESNYFLLVLKNNLPVKSFNIIKIN